MSKKAIFICIALVLLCASALGIHTITSAKKIKFTPLKIDENFDTAIGDALYASGQEDHLFKPDVYYLGGPLSDGNSDRISYEVRAMVSKSDDLDIYKIGAYKNSRIDNTYTTTINGRDITIEIQDPGDLISSPGDEEIVYEEGEFQPYIILKASNDKGHFAVKINHTNATTYHTGDRLHPDDEAFVQLFVEKYLFPDDK